MKSKFMCSLPWIHSSIQPTGMSTVCCEADHNTMKSYAYDHNEAGGIEVLSLANNTMADMINSENYKHIRREMMQGNVPSACMTCFKTEQAGGTSKRQTHRTLSIDELTQTHDDGTITPDIEILELRLGNTCNLRCRTCNAESSSLWVNDYFELHKTLDFVGNYNELHKIRKHLVRDWFLNENFYKSLSDKITNLKELHISGGEPWLIRQHTKMLKFVPDDTIISYHTNLNYDKETIMFMYNQLKDHKNVVINCSIDSIGDKLTYIRNPLNWDKAIENLNTIISLFPNTVICQTISVLNFLDIDELYTYFKNNNITNRHYLNFADSPVYMSPYLIDSNIRKKTIDNLKQILPHDLVEPLNRYYNDIQHSSSTLTQFKQYTAGLDKIRNEQFGEMFPVLKDILWNS